MVTVLRPKMKTDRYSSVQSPDWTQPPDREELPYPVSVQPAAVNGKNWYRVQVPGYASQQAAKAAGEIVAIGEATSSACRPIRAWRSRVRERMRPIVA